MFFICVVEHFDAKIINTETELRLSCCMFPKTSGQRTRLITILCEVCDELFVRQNSCLFETIHALVDFYVYITIVCDFGVDIILTADVVEKIFGMESHVLRLIHWGC